MAFDIDSDSNSLIDSASTLSYHHTLREYGGDLRDTLQEMREQGRNMWTRCAARVARSPEHCRIPLVQFGEKWAQDR